jgi:hypothetical protein
MVTIPVDRRIAPWRGRLVLATVVSVVVAVHSGAAAVKVQTGFDKKFDFGQVHTWGWNPAGAGSIMVARTAADDPAAIKRLVEPIVKEVAGTEMPRRGLTPAPTPDLTLTYYLLLTIGQTAQVQGQFLPSVAQWACRPYRVHDVAQDCRRGIARARPERQRTGGLARIGAAQIKMGLEMDKREALLREAVQKILERYPPKK